MKKLLLILLFASVSCFADSLKIIVPYAPGGNTDLTARVFAKAYTDKPGAEGQIGQNDLLTQRPDGNTLLFTGSGGIIYNSVANHANYENMKKLVPVSKVTITGQLLLTKKDNDIKTWRDLVKATETRTVAIGTNSTIMRGMIQELFGKNTNVIIVPFSSDAPAYAALLSKTVDVAVVTFVFENRVANGEANALAVTTESGHFNVPSLKELGTGVSREQWYGFFAPPNTPTEIRNKLAHDFDSLKNDKALIDQIRNNIKAKMSETLSPNEFNNAIEREYRRVLAQQQK